MERAARAPQPHGQSQPPHAPCAAEMALRARWLGAMSEADRDGLADLAIREVEERFAAWAAGVDAGT